MKRKTIVTHINPDVDAVCAVWLLKRFDQQFQEAEVTFVPAGETLNNQKVDSDPDVVHVDTGLGKFDHHQYEGKKCAASLVFNYLKSKFKHLKNDKALIRLIKVVEDIDHFRDCFWPDPTADYHNFGLVYILRGLKTVGDLNDQGVVEFGERCLEGIYTDLKIKIKAEEDLKEGYQFMTKWGKAIGCLSQNDMVLKMGQKQGFVLVVQKDPQTDHVRIKGRPDSKVDLAKMKEKLENLDSQATWYLHISGKMLLNGSTRNPKMKPSKLSLKKVIEVLRV